MSSCLDLFQQPNLRRGCLYALLVDTLEPVLAYGAEHALQNLLQTAHIETEQEILKTAVLMSMLAITKRLRCHSLSMYLLRRRES